MLPAFVHGRLLADAGADKRPPLLAVEIGGRVAAVADLHCTKTSQGAFQPLFRQANEQADVLVLCGDLTDHGLPEEAQVLARELTGLIRIPVLALAG